MKILIMTFGTHGDIQPFIALAQGLQQAGHTVTICTSEGYRSFIQAYQLPYAFMDNEMLDLTQRLLGATSLGERIATGRQMGPAIRRLMDNEWEAAQSVRPDLIIYHPKCLGSYHIAEKLGIPAMMSLPLPLYTPTKAFPVPFFANLRLGGQFNRLTYRFIAGASAMYGSTVNDFRVKSLTLKPIGYFLDLLRRSDGNPVPLLYSYSPQVVPIPPEFPPHAHVTGYWFLDRLSDWEPDPTLIQFLAEGPYPVYIGFGSMLDSQGTKRSRMVLDALRDSGQRGILASGWGALNSTDLPPTVYQVEGVPHDWLFPQVAAVVHHGGAGTTAAGLRAGKPTIICPFLGDQPFWGQVVANLGVGPNPIGQMELTTPKLTTAINTVIQETAIQTRAAALGEKIRAEDGVGRAVEVIEQYVSGRRAA